MFRVSRHEDVLLNVIIHHAERGKSFEEYKMAVGERAGMPRDYMRSIYHAAYALCRASNTEMAAMRLSKREVKYISLMDNFFAMKSLRERPALCCKICELAWKNIPLTEDLRKATFGSRAYLSLSYLEQLVKIIQNIHAVDTNLEHYWDRHAVEIVNIASSAGTLSVESASQTAQDEVSQSAAADWWCFPEIRGVNKRDC